MWVKPERATRLRQAHPVEQARRLVERGTPARALVYAHGLGDLGAHGTQGVEKGHRVLEHHPDARAANRAQLRFGCAGKVDALEQDPARIDARRRSQ